MTDRKTSARRLEAAGYVSVVVGGKPGWVPASFAIYVARAVADHAKRVEIIAATPKKRGPPFRDRTLRGY